MFGSLTLNPFKLFGVPGTMIDVGLWAVGKMKDLTLAAWDRLPKPKSFGWKCVVYPLYIYIVIPGSVPYAFVKAATWLGYGPEVQKLFDIFIGAAGSLGWLALDAFVKTLLAVLWFLITWVARL
jgi:hypothetical protein